MSQLSIAHGYSVKGYVSSVTKPLEASQFYHSNPYPQLRHEIKMASIVWGLCTESLWRGYRFVMNDSKKSKNLSGEAYIQSSNANARVLLNLSIFWLVLLFLAN